jgi:hypothetical protein
LIKQKVEQAIQGLGFALDPRLQRTQTPSYRHRILEDAKRVLEEVNATIPCPECEAYDREHNQKCKLHPDHDPTSE